MRTLKNFALYALIIGLLLIFSHTAQAQEVPDDFNPNANGLIWSIAVQTDGKILIGGTFTTLNPDGSGTITRNNIARLNADGTVDMTFNPNTNGIVYSIALQTNGKILFGGVFTTLNPDGSGTITRNNIARLNADGTVDTTFNPNTNGIVRSIALQTNGKILFGGLFQTLNPNGSGTVTRNNIARLNTDGTVDTTFDPKPNGFIYSIAVQTDGKILIGGVFTTLKPNGSGTVTRNNIARLNADGMLDTIFDPNVNNDVYSITVQRDEKIIFGGIFTTLNPNGSGTVTRNNIARLNADGTLDTTFDPNTNGSVYSIALQTDGKILIGGSFTTFNPNGSGTVLRYLIARFNADGTLNTDFDPNPNGIVTSIVVQTDGKILIGGTFTKFKGGTFTRNYIARLGFAAMAAGVSVAGRVRTPNGRGLGNAFVTLTDSNGNQRLARTTAFGYFHFEDVAAGETYIVGVSSKRYRFAPQVLSINQDIADLELTGEDIFGSPR